LKSPALTLSRHLSLSVLPSLVPFLFLLALVLSVTVLVTAHMVTELLLDMVPSDMVGLVPSELVMEPLVTVALVVFASINYLLED
jgi:hypothetical protein